MSNPLKKLAGQTAYYGLSSILGRSINFVLVIFHTKAIPEGEYGVLSDVYAIVAFLNTLFIFGMETTYFRYSSLEKESNVFNNAFTLLLCTTTIFTSGLLLSATPLINHLGYFGREEYIYLLAFIIAIDALMALPFARLRHQNKPKKFAIIRVLNILITVFLNWFLLIKCDDIYKGESLSFLEPLVNSFYSPERKIEYVFWANLIANAFFIPMLLPTFKSFQFQLQKTYVKPFLIYTYPLLFAGLSANINEVIDRRLLMVLLPDNFHISSKTGSGYTTQEAVGIYSGCYKLAMFMSLALQAFRYAAEPFFFSKAKEKDATSTYALVMKYYIIACCLILVSVTVMRFPLAAIFLRRDSYTDGLIVVPILLLANLFLGIYYNQSVWYKVTNKTKYSTYISVIGAFVTVVLNFLLIPVIGFIGSAIATLVCYFSMSLISYILGKKHYPVPYRLGHAFFYILFSLILSGLSFIMMPASLVMQILMGLGIIFVFLGFVFIKEKRSFVSH